MEASDDYALQELLIAATSGKKEKNN